MLAGGGSFRVQEHERSLRRGRGQQGVFQRADELRATEQSAPVRRTRTPAVMAKVQILYRGSPGFLWFFGLSRMSSGLPRGSPRMQDAQAPARWDARPRRGGEGAGG
eukprot:gene11302-biopygen9408